MTRTTIAAILLTTLFSVLLSSFSGAAAGGPAAARLAEPGCAPEVARTLSAAATAGTQRNLAVIRADDAGIRWPGRLADFTCLDRLLDFGRLDVHADIGRLLESILGGVTSRVCNEAARLHAAALSRSLPATLFDLAAPSSGAAGRAQRR